MINAMLFKLKNQQTDFVKKYWSADNFLFIILSIIGKYSIAVSGYDNSFTESCTA